MLTIRKILFPTDFSECAEHAFNQAADLADRYDAELHVLNIVVPRTEDPDNPLNYLDAAEIEAMDRLPEDAAHQHDIVRMVHAQEVNFSEAAGIIEYAGAQDIDLIVMGTHGRRGLGRLLLGSVAEEVVRLAPCPVLTFGVADQHEKRVIRRVLVPVDFSESSRLALLHGKELAVAFGAHLDVLHVITEVALPGVYGIETVAVATPEVRDRVGQALIQEVEGLPGARVGYDIHVLIGFPAHDIVDFAADRDTDLLVLTTHGRTGLKRLLMGSVAENVVRHAACLVLTLKSFGKSLVAEPVGEALPNEMMHGA